MTLMYCFLLGLIENSQGIQSKTITNARDQLTWGTTYDPAYVRIGYPNGDVPKTKGVCTDVIVRAYRGAKIDLQALVHNDISKSWAAYPRYPGNPKPDANIDHRRVPNLRVFFTRHGQSLLTKLDAGQWKPGDIVTWKLDSGRDHIGLLTDKLDSKRFPFVIHNLSRPAEEDCLSSWKITGHYRYPKPKRSAG